MPATLQSPFSHRSVRRLVRGLFRLGSFFNRPAEPDGEDRLPWQVRVILKILRLLESAEPPPPHKMRRLYRLLTLPYHLSTPAMAVVQDHLMPGGPRIRLYRPRGLDGRAPALVYFHGGGGVVGDLETHDPLCRLLAAGAGVVVLAVEYRLNPEDKYPAQIDDAVAAFEWARSNADMLDIDASRIGAGGDSAGAYLTLLLARQIRNSDDRPAFLWLVYPSTGAQVDTPSRREFPDGLILTGPVIDYFNRHARGGDAMPSLVDEDFANYPPALVLTVGFDPLRDEGVALAADMASAGVAVNHLHYPRLLHEFISMGGVVPEARAALAEAVDGLEALAKA